MKYRIVLQERNREVFAIEAPTADAAEEFVIDAINNGRRNELTALRIEDPREGCDVLDVWSEA